MIYGYARVSTNHQDTELQRSALELAGLAVARAKGRVGGRRPKFTDEQWQEMGERIATGESRQQIARKYGVGLSTLYKKFPVSMSEVSN
ncbi:TPA: recombinase family protein [Citrobacter freundii]